MDCLVAGWLLILPTTIVKQTNRILEPCLVEALLSSQILASYHLTAGLSDRVNGELGLVDVSFAAK